MAEAVYLTCAITSVLCAILLLRRSRHCQGQLLLWSAMCFGLLALNSLILFVDLVVLPETDIDGMFWRNLLGAGAGSTLLFGLIWELS